MKTGIWKLLMVSAIGLTACTGGDEEALMCPPRAVPSFATPPAEPCDSFSASFALKNAAGTTTSSFARNEAVTLELRLTNNASTTKSLQTPDGCGQVRLEVDSENPSCLVFSNAPTGGCTTAIVETPFAAGETKTFTATWPQTNLAGRAVGAGSYRAYGIDRSQCAAKFFSSQVLTVR